MWVSDIDWNFGLNLCCCLTILINEKDVLFRNHGHSYENCVHFKSNSLCVGVCVCVLRAISHDKFNHVLLHLSVGSFCIASGNYRNILEIRAQQQFEHFVAMKNWAEFNPILFAFEIHVNFIEIWRTNIELLNAVAEKCQICVIAYEQCTHWR